MIFDRTSEIGEIVHALIDERDRHRLDAQSEYMRAERAEAEVERLAVLVARMVAIVGRFLVKDDGTVQVDQDVYPELIELYRDAREQRSTSARTSDE